MTTWTDLTNSAVSVGGIPAGSTITALRDNDLALAEGSTGAPRIHGEAAARETDGLTVVVTSAANTVTIQHGAGEVAFLTETNSSTDVVARRYTIRTYSGFIRFKASVNSSTSSSPFYNATISLYKNGGLIGSVSENTTAPELASFDVAVAVNDVFEWRLKLNAGAATSDRATISAVSITANDGYVNQPLYILASNI
jgi:hypothetical protein